MKLNLLIDNVDGCLKDYTNIDPYASGDDGRNVGDVSNLDWVADDFGLDEIRANDILAYFPFPRIYDILTNWVQKLKVGGKLVIMGVDMEEVAVNLSYGNLNIMEASRLFWGEQKNSKGWDVKKSGLCVSDLIDWMKSVGLKINKKILTDDDYSYLVEAEKSSV